MNKKPIIFLLLSIFIFSLFAGIAQAKTASEYWDDFTGSKALQFLTVDMVSQFQTGSPSTEALMVAKILFILLLFAILFGASSMAPGVNKFSKNIRIGITLLLSVIAGIAIRSEWIVSVIQTYGGLFILALLLLPLVLLVYANFKWVTGEGRGIQLIKFIFMIALLFVLQHVNNVAKGMDISVLSTAVGIMEIIFGILAFWYLIIGFIMNSSGIGKDKLAETEVGKWFKKAGAYWPTKERQLGRKMKKFVEKAEKSMDEIKEELNTVNEGIKTARTNPGIVPQISEQVENIKPAVITGLENIKKFESVKRKIEEWNSGYIEGLRTEKEKLKTEAATAKGKITRGKLTGAVKSKQEDIIKSHEQVILQIDEIIKDAEAIFLQLRAMEDIYKTVDGDIRKIWESVGNLKTLLDTKSAGYLNQSYKVSSGSLKLAERARANQAKLEKYITNVRALIDKERLDARKTVRDIKKARRVSRTK